MKEVLLNFIKNYQEGNYPWLFFTVFIVVLFISIYIIVVRGNRSSDKILRNREMHKIEMIFENIYAAVSRLTKVNRIIDENDLYILIYSGEQYTENYRSFVPLIKEFLDKVLEKTQKFKIISVAGTKLMVKKLKNDYWSMHPSMELLADEKYGKHIEFYLVRDYRIPYHFLYSPLAASGLAETPHHEITTPMIWTFENKEEYKKLFSNWLKLIKEKYDLDLLFFKGNRLYRKNIKEGKEKPVNTKDNLFFLKTFRLKIRSFHSKDILEQIKYHRNKTNLPMRNWNPYSSNLFSDEDRMILA
ncbi:MAG: hypothetical protein GTO45_00110 [Candidatus Aminicenantes bacterium]|nr:hypothetical protein [Candidatus Aminicenantes bacterium]NIM77170.1 hypothetical protein [Candidatus Aminicenantes bacterium]NIN16463.1 hypothetical protein [Candidatus Aminicenantes bacterium]NIN40324.1 hypothetical protein [Candidatus Aminicenantes bacterium]NIN83143.1 hypothetical protein [Candidatus Aminicenantes bacterium]